MAHKLTMEIKTITPEIAKQYLARNYENNRPAKTVNIAKMSSDIESGRWVLTHQGIAFDPDGYLFDGANRMRAIIKSGKAAEMCVFRYNDWAMAENAMKVLDIGVKRTIKDAYTISDPDSPAFKRCTAIHGLVRKIIGIERNVSFVRFISQGDIMQYIDSHDDELRDVYTICKSFRGSNASGNGITAIVGCAIIKAIRAGVNHSDIVNFVETYTNNVVVFPDHDYGVKHALDCRRYVKISSRNTTDVDYDMLYKIESYIYAFVNNKQRFKTREYYPLQNDLTNV